jgi:hypothetical protein
MNRNGGLIAGLVVVLMILGVSNLPKNAESPGATELGKRATPAPNNPSGSELQSYPACTELADRLRRFVGVPGQASKEWKLPGSCYKAGQAPNGLKSPQASPDVQFAIATVPNPISTHLALLFDRMVAAIQKAAQDESYSYDDSWFPWDATTKDYSSLADQQAAQGLQKIQGDQPGVMVFRPGQLNDKPYEGGLIVFLVGEKPTGGINDRQFDNALAWMAQLGGIPGRQPLRILGPTFSGSLPSLQRALDWELTAGQLKGYKDQLQVWSGTVSSGFDHRWFKEWIENRQDGSFFKAVMENDSLMTDRFCQYLSDQGYSLENVAFLSEDETAFEGSHLRQQQSKEEEQSNQDDSPCSRAQQFFYPRDIATLRSAYEQQAILGPAKPQSNANAPSTTLRADLSEPSSSDHDTIRSFGGQVTPLAQESILLDIAKHLNEQQIQFIILRSTSSLDQIFLSQFLRRAHPGGRVVIDGADLLFTRGAEGTSLRGVMLLSTYPLLTVERAWTSPLPNVPTNTGYRTFGEDASEGVYISARALFGDQDHSIVPIYDYTAPAWAKDPNGNRENTLPATWLTVIGHRQFWPVAALNSNTLPTLKNARMPMPAALAQAEDQSGSDDFKAELLKLPTEMWLFVIACFGWSWLHGYFCRAGSIFGSPRARAYFAPIAQWQHPALIALGSVLLAMLAIVVAATSGLFSWPEASQLYQPNARNLLAVSVLLILALSTLACVANYRVTPSCASDSRTTRTSTWRHRAGWTAIGCLAGFAAIHISLIHKLTRANSIPAYWRGVNLLSGVSPLLPQVLFIAGAYLWSWCTLRGLAHFGDDGPLLPKSDDLPKLDDGTPAMPMFSREKAGCWVEDAARPLTKSYLIRLLVVSAIIAVAFWVALPDLVRTLGERQFGTLILVWMGLCIAVIIADGIQMWLAWSRLRQLLVFLDRLTLRRTLRALKGLAWGSIWKLSGNVLEERYRVISLQFESLRHLGNTLEEWAPNNDSEEAPCCSR